MKDQFRDASVHYHLKGSSLSLSPSFRALPPVFDSLFLVGFLTLFEGGGDLFIKLVFDIIL